MVCGDLSDSNFQACCVLFCSGFLQGWGLVKCRWPIAAICQCHDQAKWSVIATSKTPTPHIHALLCSFFFFLPTLTESSYMSFIIHGCSIHWFMIFDDCWSHISGGFFFFEERLLVTCVVVLESSFNHHEHSGEACHKWLVQQLSGCSGFGSLLSSSNREEEDACMQKRSNFPRRGGGSLLFLLFW